jgi:hypothetical protein
MGRFQDLLQSQDGWIHELARGETHPDAEWLLQSGGSSDPQQLVEESTISFLTELREQINEYARIFNTFAESGAKFQEIKVYNVAQTAADFMIFRNQIKLVVSNAAHGVIRIGFSQHVRGNISVDGQMIQAQASAGSAQAQDFMAQLGPFRDVYWTFQGEKVTSEQISKFYFSEFARATRDTRRLRADNQLLLDKIKALLNEKGLDL